MRKKVAAHRFLAIGPARKAWNRCTQILRILKVGLEVAGSQYLQCAVQSQNYIDY